MNGVLEERIGPAPRGPKQVFEGKSVTGKMTRNTEKWFREEMTEYIGQLRGQMPEVHEHLLLSSQRLLFDNLVSGTHKMKAVEHSELETVVQTDDEKKRLKYLGQFATSKTKIPYTNFLVCLESALAKSDLLHCLDSNFQFKQLNHADQVAFGAPLVAGLRGKDFVHLTRPPFVVVFLKRSNVFNDFFGILADSPLLRVWKDGSGKTKEIVFPVGTSIFLLGVSDIRMRVFVQVGMTYHPTSQLFSASYRVWNKEGVGAAQRTVLQLAAPRRSMRME